MSNTNVTVGQKVVAPVTDKDGEAGHVIGLLVAINSRIATVELSDGTIVKVGKTKVEPFEEPKAKKSTKAKGCPKCGESADMFDYNDVKGTIAAKEAPYPSMTKRCWCQACGHEWGGAVLTNSPNIDQSRYNYFPCKAASGRNSCDNGDLVASMLRGKTLEEVYQIASSTLETPIATLKAGYSHLNPGQQRMCLGNRMRKLVKAD